MASGTINRDVSGVLSTIKSIEKYGSSTQRGFKFNFIDGDSMIVYVGKLDASTNYLQINVNGYDKGYIKFDVSRNIDNW